MLKKISVGAGIAVIVTVVFLITNTDEVISANIESVLSEIEYDPSTLNSIIDVYPANTNCEYAVLTEEAKLVFFFDHSDWFYQNFGDIHEEYKEKYVNSEYATMRIDSPVVQKFLMEYFDELQKRVNPKILQNYQVEDWPYTTLYGDYPNESECNEVFKQVFNPNQ